MKFVKCACALVLSTVIGCASSASERSVASPPVASGNETSVASAPNAARAESAPPTGPQPLVIAGAEEPVDGEALAVFATADRGEIEMGALARTRASSARVRSLGEMLVTMHTQSSERMSALARRINVSPRESERSRLLAQDARATQAHLNGLHGAAFDRAYLEAQSAQHQRVLEMVDGLFMTSVRNAELREAITRDVRPMVSSHLEQSRALQTQTAGR